MIGAITGRYSEIVKELLRRVRMYIMPYTGYITIYTITNKKNGMIYVGQTRHYEGRVRSHIQELNRGSHICYPLQVHWDLLGSKGFEFNIVKQVLGEIEARRVEQEVIKSYEENGIKLHNLNHVKNVKHRRE